MPPQSDRPEVLALAPADTTALDRSLGPLVEAHPGEAGFRLVRDGREAFALRWFSAAQAERSLDVQTYIWHADDTGLALAAALLEAADRGVRVRLLIDDLDARARSLGFAALSTHPRIDVRLFNPFASRRGFLGMLAEALGSFRRINRRMHNKSWLADGRIALVGGRNLGDEYFAASDTVNFEDLDVAMLGPVVADVARAFDSFWNAEQAYAIETLAPDAATEANLARLRQDLERALVAVSEGDYAAELRRRRASGQLFDADARLHWTADYHFVSDSPFKEPGVSGIEATRVGQVLFPAMLAAQSRLDVISPYFVPGPVGTQRLVDLAAAGVQVRVLTNSLAANDVAAVHGGYARRRGDLLAGGVALWEIKATRGGPVDPSFAASAGASLHTKALAIDGDRVFVGSYNLDPRSTNLNSEQGVLVRDAGLGAEFRALFEDAIAADRAWAVTLEQGDLVWVDDDTRHTHEPGASAWRRFQAWLARVLGLESQL